MDNDENIAVYHIWNESNFSHKTLCLDHFELDSSRAMEVPEFALWLAPHWGDLERNVVALSCDSIWIVLVCKVINFIVLLKYESEICLYNFYGIGIGLRMQDVFRTLAVIKHVLDHGSWTDGRWIAAEFCDTVGQFLDALF